MNTSAPAALCVNASPARVDTFESRAAFVLTRLLRPGEESAAAWPVDLKRQAKGLLVEMVASWVEFIESRYATWHTVIKSGLVDELPIGWTDAAVRVYGGDALVALSDLRVPPWPGRSGAENFLRKTNAGIARERAAWERG